MPFYFSELAGLLSKPKTWTLSLTPLSPSHSPFISVAMPCDFCLLLEFIYFPSPQRYCPGLWSHDLLHELLQTLLARPPCLWASLITLCGTVPNYILDLTLATSPYTVHISSHVQTFLLPLHLTIYISHA